MKFLPAIALWLTAFTAHALDLPGWTFPGEIIRQGDIPLRNSTSLLIRIQTDDPRRNTIRLIFNQKTRMITEANWQTKGEFPLKLPTSGVRLPEPSSPDARPVVILSAEKLKPVGDSDVGLANFTWEKRHQPTAGEISFAEARRLVEDYVIEQGYTDAPTSLKPAELQGSTLERFPRSEWLAKRHGRIFPRAVAYTHEVLGDAPGWTFGFLYQAPADASKSTIDYTKERYFSVQISRTGQNILVPHSPLFRASFTPLREK